MARGPDALVITFRVAKRHLRRLVRGQRVAGSEDESEGESEGESEDEGEDDSDSDWKA